MSAKMIRFLSILAAIPILISLGWIASQAQEKPFSETKVGPIAYPVTIYDDESSPISAALTIDPLPKIGEPATLQCIVSSVYDAPNTQVVLELPADAQLLKGDLNWQGDILAGNSITLSVSVAFTEGGEEDLLCRVNKYVDENNSWGDLAELFLTIGEEASIMGYAPITPVIAELATPGDGQAIDTGSIHFPAVPSTEPIPSLAPELDNPASLPAMELRAGTLTITGSFKYFDRFDTYVGAANMLVEIVRGDTGAHLAYCYTDTAGQYTCPPFTNPGAAGVRAWVMSYASNAPKPDVLAVVNPDLGATPDFANTYKIITGVYSYADGLHSIGEWYIGNGFAPEQAYWIERDLINAWVFVWQHGGGSRVPQTPSGPATVEWKSGLNPAPGEGAHYHPGGNIHIFDVSLTSRTVVNHEYGHNVMFNIYGDTSLSESCGGSHVFYNPYNDGCAWSEGWASFLDLAVRNDPIHYWSETSFVNVENATWGSTNWPNNGDLVEGRVTAALWDMIDSVNDGSDEYSGSFSEIWDEFASWDNHNFTQFFAMWKSFGHPELLPVMAIYQNTIDYRSSPPGAFTKSSPANAATNQPASVTLSWAASTGATSYAYCYDTSNNNTCSGSWVSTNTIRTATISGLSPSTTYYWQVRAQKSTSHTYANESTTVGPNSWRSFTTGTVPTAFNKSGPTNGATNQLTSLTLSWAAATNFTSYSYCYDTTNDGSCAVWTNTGTTRTANLTGLTRGTTYYWQARAINSFGSTFANGGSGAYWSFAIDGTAPSVTSIVRANTTPTNAASVNFTVTFSESVSGVGTPDFTLTTSGLSGTSVTSVSGSGATRTVAVNTGSGSGTIRLNVPASATITDLAGNPLASLPYTGGQTYTIDKTAPTLAMTSLASNPTNASPIAVSVTFSESVTGFTSTDILPANGAVSNFAGTGASYTFDLTPAGQGLVTADIAAGVATDSAGNGNTLATQFSRAYDTTTPTVLSSLRANSNPTAATSVNFTVTFSESVTGVNVSDFSLTTSGVSGTAVSGVSGSGSVYTVTVNTGSGNGTIRLNVPASATITDLAGNPLASLPYTGGQTYTIDKTAPTLAMTSLASNPTNASPIAVSVTFSESVTGFTSTDILPANGTVSNFAGTGASYTFDLTPAGQGLVTADIAAGVATDSAGNGNTLATQFSRAYDTTAPTVLSSLRASPNPTNAAIVNFTVTFSESVTGVNVSDFSLTTSGVSGTAVSGVSGSGSVYTVTVNTGSGNGTIRLDVPVSAIITDPAGNPLASLPYTGGETYTITKVFTIFLPLILH